MRLAPFGGVRRLGAPFVLNGVAGVEQHVDEHLLLPPASA
jgi:hypothetical protein